MLDVFAEFGRAMIVQRVRAGIAKARAQGTRSGEGHRADKIAAVRAALVA
jgi:DNA invertase Pin-like site-specific DNA recombinase